MGEEDKSGCGVSGAGVLLGGLAGLFAGYLYLNAGTGVALAWGTAAGGGSGGGAAIAILIIAAVFFGGGALLGRFVALLIRDSVRTRRKKRGPKRVSAYPRLKRPKRRR